MNRIIVIDIGNTNIKFAQYEGSTIISKLTIKTNSKIDPLELSNYIETKIKKNMFNCKSLDGIVVSSDVPSINHVVNKICKSLFNILPLYVEDFKLQVNYGNIKIGNDHISCIEAAQHLYGPSFIIVSLGTAATYSIVIDNKYLGGLIAPGFIISKEAMFKAIPILKEQEILKPSSVIGKNTYTATESGLFYGYISQTEGIIKRIQNEFNVPLKVILAGGLSHLFHEESQ